MLFQQRTVSETMTDVISAADVGERFRPGYAVAGVQWSSANRYATEGSMDL